MFGEVFEIMIIFLTLLSDSRRSLSRRHEKDEFPLASSPNDLASQKSQKSVILCPENPEIEDISPSDAFDNGDDTEVPSNTISSPQIITEDQNFSAAKFRWIQA